MGGYIQAQAHVQLVSALIDDGLDPQAALDRARFRVDQRTVRLEEGLWSQALTLEQAGLSVVGGTTRLDFGGGQAILIRPDHLLGGSDARKDGFAAGFDDRPTNHLLKGGTVRGVRLDHATINTADLESTIEFHNRYLGLRTGFRPDFGFPSAWLYAEDGDYPIQPIRPEGDRQ